MSRQRMLPPSSPDFDAIARSYRWLEYLTLGRTLERCRLHFLDKLVDRRRALVLGDGDGRFLAALFSQNKLLTADAVDTSAAMLHLLRIRCDRILRGATSRLRTYRADARSFVAGPSVQVYDLVVTHFFLDCLTQEDLDALAEAMSQRLAPGAVWLISDFRIPSGAMKYPAKLLIRLLYLVFRVLTGLRTSHLPDHASALLTTGFKRVAVRRSLFGALATELWILQDGTP